MSQDPKEILIQHGEKIALGVAVALAAAVFFTSGSGAGEAADEIKASVGKIVAKQKKGVADSEKPTVPDPVAKVMAPWQPAKAAMPEDLPWTYYRQPQIDVTTSFGPPPVVVTQMAKTGIRASVTRDLIDVQWDQPPGEGKDPDNAEKTCQRARLLGFELHKWREGSADIDKVFLSGSNTTYSDRNFEPETTYRYKVRAFFELEREGWKKYKESEVKGGEIGVVEGGDFKDQKARFTGWTDAASATTALNIELTFKSRIGNQATFFVWQFWKGAPWRMEYKLDLGEDIGRMVSPKDLVSDKYNKGARAGDPAYQELQTKAADKADGDKPSIPWRSGMVYLGFYRASGKDLAVLEHQKVRVSGLCGLDWGTKIATFERSNSTEPPDGVK